MKVLILGGDGYLGWPTAMRLSRHGHDVTVLDSLAKRAWERELGVEPLLSISPLGERVRTWQEKTGAEIKTLIGDLTDDSFIHAVLADVEPDGIVHYGEQPSAPYSMIDRRHAAFTQYNNVIGTLNVLFAMRDVAPDCHLVKLGTMGEYGTPNIDIEEGYVEIHHRGRSDRLPFPKMPGSFYHLSKVHDSHNIMFACRVWGLRATDLNQGVVYGVETDETALDPRLATSFHYDECFGTALNRFCVQAIIGWPLTVYGAGGQTRGFLNIEDTLQCVELALLNPAPRGQLRVFNQFTEQFSVLQLAQRVRGAAEALGYSVELQHLPNPRIEMENHYYNARHDALLRLGLVPRLLSTVLLDSMLQRIGDVRDRVNPDFIEPRTAWMGAGYPSPVASYSQMTG